MQKKPSQPSGPNISRRKVLAAGAAIPAVGVIAGTPAAAATQDANPVDLSGKSVLITGCSSGFGRLGAVHYAEAGAKVIATMRGLPREEASDLLKEAKANKLDLHVVEIDVLDDASVAAGYAAAKAIIGGAPDVLINNAGIAIVGPLEAQDLEATKLAYDTNVFGYQRMIRAVLPAMRARKSGHIINMSSQSGRMIWPGLGHYCPTKFAIEAMSDTLAYETALMGVDVTCIQPGGYPTDFWENREELTKALKDRSDEAHLDGYGAMSANMGSGKIPNLPGDPGAVVASIAHAMALSAGQRPLRVMESHWGNPQEPLNTANRDVHLNFLGRGPFAEAAKRAHGAS